MAVRYSDGPNGLQIDADGEYNLGHTHAMEHGMEFQAQPGRRGELETQFDVRGRPYPKGAHPRQEQVTLRPRTRDCVVNPRKGRGVAAQPSSPVDQNTYLYVLAVIVAALILCYAISQQ